MFRCTMGGGGVTPWPVANNAPHTPVPLILTRPRPASEAFWRNLPVEVRARFTPIFSPLIDITPLHPATGMPDDYNAIFTSANGLRHASPGQGRAAYCVGPATAQAAQAHGWAAEQCGVDADSLVTTLLRTRPGAPLVHLSGRHTRGRVAERLAAAGLNVQHIALYDQQICDLSGDARDAIAREKHVLVPLFSPRTAAQFAKTAPRATSVHIIALSAAVAEALGDAPMRPVQIAASPDARAMGAALAAWA